MCALALLVQNRFVVMILPYLLLLFFHVMEPLCWFYFKSPNSAFALFTLLFQERLNIQVTVAVILVWIAVIPFDLLVYWRKGFVPMFSNFILVPDQKRPFKAGRNMSSLYSCFLCFYVFVSFVYMPKISDL